MDNAAVAHRYRKQAEARLEMAGLFISNEPSVQFDDRGDQHVTRANIGMLLWSAAVDLASALFIQERRTQPNGRSPLISRFVTQDLPSIGPRIDYEHLWRATVRLHTAQHSTDTAPLQFARDCNDSSLLFEVLNWLIAPANYIPLNSYGWLRRVRTEYTPVRDDSPETVATLGKLQQSVVGTGDSPQALPVHWAAQNPDPMAIALLFANGADVEARDDAMATPLHWAAAHGSPKVIEVLVIAGADLAAGDLHNATPLHHAARSNSADAVMALIQHGANISPRDRNGETPLHQAAIWQQDPMVTEILIQHGGDPDMANLDGQTPRSLASQFNPILDDMMASA